MKKAFKKIKGFSMIELLVYIVILAIVFTAVINYINWTIKVNNKSQAVREVAENAKIALDAITYEIKEGTGIYFPTSGLSQLSLETGHYIPDQEESSYIDFFLCGADQDVLCIKKESQNPVAITSEKVAITSLEFIYIASSSIGISLDVEYKDSLNRLEYQASTTIRSNASLRSY